MRRGVAGIAFILATFLPMSGNAGPFAAHRAVSDDELASMRGGFRLPNGVELAMAVQIDSIVNGRLVLRSVLTADSGPPDLKVYAPGNTSGPTVAQPSATPATPTGVQVTFDPGSGITRIEQNPGVPTNPTNMQVSTTGVVNNELTPVVAPPGVAVQTPNGSVTVDNRAGRVILNGEGLQVQHLVGRALGTIISNERNGQTIDSNMVVHLNLGGVTPDKIGSALQRATDTVLDSIRRPGD